jgi:hypothetical protein
MIFLDTDHVSIVQRRSDACDRLFGKLNQAVEVPMTSVITLEEQSRSWITEIGRRRDVSDQVTPYRRLIELFEFFHEWDGRFDTRRACPAKGTKPAVVWMSEISRQRT